MIRHFLNVLAFVSIINLSYGSSNYYDDDYLSWTEDSNQTSSTYKDFDDDYLADRSSSSATSVGYESDDSTGDFIATSFSESRARQPQSSKLSDLGDLSGMFRDEGDAVLLGVQRQLASQQQDIEFLKQRLALLVHQSAAGNQAVMLMEEDRFSEQESKAAFRKTYESLSFKEKVVYKFKMAKEKIKNFYHKHFDTIVKGAIAVAFKIAGLILISFL